MFSLALMWKRNRQEKKMATALQRAFCTSKGAGTHAHVKKQSRNQPENKHKPNGTRGPVGGEDVGVRGGAKQANRRGILGGPGRR